MPNPGLPEAENAPLMPLLSDELPLLLVAGLQNK